MTSIMKSSLFWPIIALIMIVNLSIGVIKQHSYKTRERSILIESLTRRCTLMTYNYQSELAVFRCETGFPDTTIKIPLLELLEVKKK